ncbi:TraR/DksA C4-type zinc finger protein [Sinorhizobium medicae]|uniref:TraR/DksA C4-type zinc finger protein n=1 Tax=Sinorhizobium medicae TaxID=110321 RepID=UPI0004159EE6|nr:TraR/DksA C4-type zinc finger protein [Sinorhizobium medicae]RVQ76130.1 TraR/DksA family transcriptional regulator [Sinorhizobium medicae]
MFTSNFDIELAEERIERERQAAIARAGAALEIKGFACCCRCGGEIDPRRRAALPSARTCIVCAGGRKS